MAAVNGESEGDKGGPPPPSPLTGCYLLIVIGEPHSKDHKDIILQRIAKGLLSWDASDCLVDLEKELAIITEQSPEGEEARYGERLIQFASENLVTEVLIHPVVSTLAQCVRNLLSSFTRHRHIIHSGYTFAANGSWILQDGTFSLADFSEAFQEIEVQRVIRAYENGISMDIHCSPEGDWNNLPKEPFTRYCKVRINPNDELTSGSPSISSFIDYISPFLVPAEIETLLESSDVVGNIRFSHPTLYVFPGGQGDAALFGINGFNMLLDGGFSRKSCFWDFVRHLDRLDAVLLTRLNNSNVNGISAVLRRKRQNAVYPQIGHFFCNIPDKKSVLSPDGDKDRDSLLINILEEGHEIISNLQHLSLTPQSCYRDSEPINLYHKVGHGTLDMYVLSPAKDSREVREFMQKWNNNDQKLFSYPKNTKDFVFPVQNLVSICALLVWQPANPEDNITRILYPGSTPQHKIFEGLDKIKHLAFTKHPICSESSLTPSISATALKAKSIIDRIVPEQKPPKKIFENKQKEKLTKENKIIENGDATDLIEKQIKKSESTEGDKIAPKLQKPKKLDTEKETIEKTEDKQKTKPKLETKTKQRSESQQRKAKPVEKKASPTTPKKTIDSKLNGEIPKSKPIGKASPQATPAKSVKEASNRRVVESKYKQTSKPPSKPIAEKKDVKERKPVTRKAKETPTSKPPSSPLKKVNGIAKSEVIAARKARLDKEATTDSSTVSTPSADQESLLKKDISKLTPEEIEKLKAQELADLKEEQEVVKEIEAVFRKGETEKETHPDMRKIKDLSVEEKEKEEYLVIEKEEIVHIKEDEIQKLIRDSEESEKQKPSAQIAEYTTEVKEKVITSKEESVASPEDKVDTSSERKTIDRDVEEYNKEVVDTQPDEKVSGNIESGATTTAPTLPEDERIPLDEIKEDNGDQAIEEKHVKEDTKEKEVPVIQLPPKTFETIPKLPPVVGIRLDKHSNIRDLVKTPDEVADLPVHEEVDINNYEEYRAVESAKESAQYEKFDDKKNKEEDKPIIIQIKKVDEVKQKADEVSAVKQIEVSTVTQNVKQEQTEKAKEIEKFVESIVKEEKGKQTEIERLEEIGVVDKEEVKQPAEEDIKKDKDVLKKDDQSKDLILKEEPKETIKGEQPKQIVEETIEKVDKKIEGLLDEKESLPVYKTDKLQTQHLEKHEEIGVVQQEIQPSLDKVEEKKKEVVTIMVAAEQKLITTEETRDFEQVPDDKQPEPITKFPHDVKDDEVKQKEVGAKQIDDKEMELKSKEKQTEEKTEKPEGAEERKEEELKDAIKAENIETVDKEKSTEVPIKDTQLLEEQGIIKVQILEKPLTTEQSKVDEIKMQDQLPEIMSVKSQDIPLAVDVKEKSEKIDKAETKEDIKFEKEKELLADISRELQMEPGPKAEEAKKDIDEALDSVTKAIDEIGISQKDTEKKNVEATKLEAAIIADKTDTKPEPIKEKVTSKDITVEASETEQALVTDTIQTITKETTLQKMELEKQEVLVPKDITDLKIKDIVSEEESKESVNKITESQDVTKVPDSISKQVIEISKEIFPECAKSEKHLEEIQMEIETTKDIVKSETKETDKIEKTDVLEIDQEKDGLAGDVSGATLKDEAMILPKPNDVEKIDATKFAINEKVESEIEKTDDYEREKSTVSEEKQFSKLEADEKFVREVEHPEKEKVDAKFDKDGEQLEVKNTFEEFVKSNDYSEKREADETFEKYDKQLEKEAVDDKFNQQTEIKKTDDEISKDLKQSEKQEAEDKLYEHQKQLEEQETDEQLVKSNDYLGKKGIDEKFDKSDNQLEQKVTDIKIVKDDTLLQKQLKQKAIDEKIVEEVCYLEKKKDDEKVDKDKEQLQKKETIETGKEEVEEKFDEYDEQQEQKVVDEKTVTDSKPSEKEKAEEKVVTDMQQTEKQETDGKLDKDDKQLAVKSICEEFIKNEIDDKIEKDGKQLEKTETDNNFVRKDDHLEKKKIDEKFEKHDKPLDQKVVKEELVKDDKSLEKEKTDQEIVKSVQHIEKQEQGFYKDVEQSEHEKVDEKHVDVVDHLEKKEIDDVIEKDEKQLEKKELDDNFIKNYDLLEKKELDEKFEKHNKPLDQKVIDEVHFKDYKTSEAEKAVKDKDVQQLEKQEVDEKLDEGFDHPEKKKIDDKPEEDRKKVEVKETVENLLTEVDYPEKKKVDEKFNKDGKQLEEKTTEEKLIEVDYPEKKESGKDGKLKEKKIEEKLVEKIDHSEKKETDEKFEKEKKDTVEKLLKHIDHSEKEEIDEKFEKDGQQLEEVATVEKVTGVVDQQKQKEIDEKFDKDEDLLDGRKVDEKLDKDDKSLVTDKKPVEDIHYLQKQEAEKKSDMSEKEVEMKEVDKKFDKDVKQTAKLEIDEKIITDTQTCEKSEKELSDEKDVEKDDVHEKFEKDEKLSEKKKADEIFDKEKKLDKDIVKDFDEKFDKDGKDSENKKIDEKTVKECSFETKEKIGEKSEEDGKQMQKTEADEYEKIVKSVDRLEEKKKEERDDTDEIQLEMKKADEKIDISIEQLEGKNVDKKLVKDQSEEPKKDEHIFSTPPGKEFESTTQDRKESIVSEEEKLIVKSVLQDAQQVAQVDKKLQELKSKIGEESDVVSTEIKAATVEPKDTSVLKSVELIEKIDLGSKSPKEREQDVAKIVATVAEVLKSDAPLEELEEKVIIPSISSITTQLRETHITTQDHVSLDMPEKDEVTTTILEQEVAIDRSSSLLQDSKELMQETSKIIADIKSGKAALEKTESTESSAVHRMLVTASSEDGGEETVICPAGSITFSRSSESSGRSSPDIQSDSISTVKTSIDLKEFVGDSKKVEQPLTLSETIKEHSDLTISETKEQDKESKEISKAETTYVDITEKISGEEISEKSKSKVDVLIASKEKDDLKDDEFVKQEISKVEVKLEADVIEHIKADEKDQYEAVTDDKIKKGNSGVVLEERKEFKKADQNQVSSIITSEHTSTEIVKEIPSEKPTDDTHRGQDKEGKAEDKQKQILETKVEQSILQEEKMTTVDIKTASEDNISTVAKDTTDNVDKKVITMKAEKDILLTEEVKKEEFIKTDSKPPVTPIALDRITDTKLEKESTSVTKSSKEVEEVQVKLMESTIKAQLIESEQKEVKSESHVIETAASEKDSSQTVLLEKIETTTSLDVVEIKEQLQKVGVTSELSKTDEEITTEAGQMKKDIQDTKEKEEVGTSVTKDKKKDDEVVFDEDSKTTITKEVESSYCSSKSIDIQSKTDEKTEVSGDSKVSAQSDRKGDVKPVDVSLASELLDCAGPSKRKESLTSHLSPHKVSTEDLNLSGKSTPDIADVERLREMQEILKHEKHIPGSCTPPTVPVSPVVKDEGDSSKLDVRKSTETSPLSSIIKDSEVRSITPASDDYEISSGQVSRAANLLEAERNDSEDDFPGSPNSITSQLAHSHSTLQYEFEESVKSQDPMNLSFYGSLPHDDEAEMDFEKALHEHRQTRGEDLGRKTSSSYLFEVTKAKYGASGSSGPSSTHEEFDSLMTSSFIGELPSGEQHDEKKTEETLKEWGKPLGLPSPAPPTDNKGTPKKERKLPAHVSAKNKINDDKKRAESPSKIKHKKTNAVYLDLTYVPHHGNSNYSYVEFFKRVRARYYVFSGIEPSKEVYNALLEAKQTWEDKDLEVTIIPTYDTDILGYWVAENEDLLVKYKIDLSPSASRCTINLQDHETSCSAYRLEF